MQILDGRMLAKIIREKLKKEIEENNQKLGKPKLVAISIGDSKKFELYLRNKNIACNELGISYENINLPENVTQETLLRYNT